jgi:hypothetical protein
VVNQDRAVSSRREHRVVRNIGLVCLRRNLNWNWQSFYAELGATANIAETTKMAGGKSGWRIKWWEAQKNSPSS